MGGAQLKILLTSGSSSIVFKARGYENSPGAKPVPPFLTHSLLRNAIFLKSGEGMHGLRTRAFFPFDNSRATKGGTSFDCEAHMSVSALETFFGARLDGLHIQDDLRKLEVLARTPSFAPFLLKDTFERAAIAIDPAHFQVSQSEAEALKDSLKAKLKPLAGMALQSSEMEVGSAKLDLLVKKLWDLDDPGFLAPFAHALKIPAGQTTDVLYAWIGVSYFHREFTKRQAALRSFAEWLISKPPFGPGVREEVVAQFEADRKPVRDRVRASWSAAGGIFDRYISSYDRLIQHSDASLFVKYLQTVREDFAVLGAHLAFIEQAICIYDVIAKEPRGSQLSIELLRDLSSSMRGPDGVPGLAA